MNKIYMPKDVELIIEQLNKSGFEGFAVGGCIRDSLLHRNPNDWDITTNALPHDVSKIFNKTIPTGMDHGTVTVVLNNNNYEITTYRIDGEYKDGRRPENVLFVTNIKEDLGRRDFTINALAYNNDSGLIDYYSGVEDLNNKIIRAVGIPKIRFREDALRMMRAIRFSAQLGFEIEKATKSAINDLSYTIGKVSIERIREEFNKLIINDPDKINDLLELGLLQEFIPELVKCKGVKQFNPHHIYDVYDHTINSVKNIDNKLYLRLTMLFHDLGKVKCKTTDDKGIDHFYKHNIYSKGITEVILRRMKYDNKTIEKVLLLVEHHDRVIDSNKSIRKVLSILGEDLFRDLLKVKRADLLAQNPVYFEEGINKLKIIENKFTDIINRNECVRIKDLKVNGKDLLEIGLKPGKEIGVILNKLLELVIEKPDENDYDKLISKVKKWTAIK